MYVEELLRRVFSIAEALPRLRGLKDGTSGRNWDRAELQRHCPD